jgi:hypothetical protein
MLLDRITSPEDARAVRAARQIREQFTQTNKKRADAADRQRARILAAARRVSRREVLSKAALARVVHGRLRRESPGGRVPSVRTIRRFLPALKDL